MLDKPVNPSFGTSGSPLSDTILTSAYPPNATLFGHDKHQYFPHGMQWLSAWLQCCRRHCASPMSRCRHKYWNILSASLPAEYADAQAVDADVGGVSTHCRSAFHGTPKLPVSITISASTEGIGSTSTQQPASTVDMALRPREG